MVLAMILALATAAAEGQGPDSHIQQVRLAWANGDLAEVDRHAQAALEIIQASGCPVSPMAASLFYYSALADQISINQDEHGYRFWVALAINERVGGLSRMQQDIAEEFSSPPGHDRRYDWMYAQSPFLEGRIGELGTCEDQPLGELQGTAYAEGETAFLYARLRTRFNGEITRIIPVLSYPAEEVSDIADALKGYMRHTDRHNEVVLFTFTPCMYINTTDLQPVQICRGDWLESSPSAP